MMWRGVTGSEYNLVTTEQALEDCLGWLSQQSHIGVDTETSSKLWWNAELAGVSLGSGRRHWYIPVGHPVDDAWPQLPQSHVRQRLADFFRQYERRIYMWNAKYDVHIFRECLDIEFTQPITDGLIITKLLDENEPAGLKDQAEFHLHPQAGRWERDVAKWRKAEAKRQQADLSWMVKAGVPNDVDVAPHEARARASLEAEGKDPKAWKVRARKLLRDEYKARLQAENPTLSGKVGDVTYKQVPVELMGPYAAADTDYTYHLIKRRLPEITGKLVELFHVEHAVMRAIIKTEYRGMPLDTEYLRSIRPVYVARKNAAVRAAHADAGRPFNLGSWRQLLPVLEEKGVPLVEWSKTSREKLRKGLITEDQAVKSTSFGALAPFAADYPIIESVIEYLKASKVLGSYIDGLLARGSRVIHAGYNQNGAKTGRWSSSKPCMQNVAPDVKPAFVCPDGYVFLAVDYSQVELRVLAHLSQDTTLMACYPWEGEGTDVHTRTAAEVIYGESLEKYFMLDKAVQKILRLAAKRVNFGISYGAMAATIHRQIRLDYIEAGLTSTPPNMQECKRFIEAFFERYEGVTRYQAEVTAELHRQGYVENMYGRRRRLPAAPRLAARFKGLKPKSDEWWQVRGELGRLERQANNFVIQGAAADIFKRTVARLGKLLETRRTYMCNYVHDDIQFFVHRSELDILPEIMDIVMDYPEISVPLASEPDVSVTSWGEAEKLLGVSLSEKVRELDAKVDRVRQGSPFRQAGNC